MTDLDRLFAEHGMKLYEITIRKGKVTFLIYRRAKA